ncbi:uncharacterized protein LDX57_001895 [Aspergillus melleus]|uniref:uncharacterized protein n=1 Tax=Aspergillus melleus TaxID=138277 RepID=UPI001E8DB0F5|nr:uncharacterized protein LDX57_001895 [Aspergillus melleus]KAH8424141.1 hypothetical protein LDX57_001895 [Aspergillus melleus]
MQFEFAFNVIMILALTSLKLSVLCFYRRLFVGRFFNNFSKLLILIACLWGVVFLVVFLGHCGTRLKSRFESLGSLKSHCLDTFALFIALAVSDVAVDVAILAVPIPMGATTDLFTDSAIAPASPETNRYTGRVLNRHDVSVPFVLASPAEF